MRQNCYATLERDGRVIASAQKFAFNSAIRESEALVRTLARSEGQPYEGDKPSRTGDVYRREWRGTKDGRTVRAVVCATPDT